MLKKTKRLVVDITKNVWSWSTRWIKKCRPWGSRKTCLASREATGPRDNVGSQVDSGVSDASLTPFNIIKAKWGQRRKVAFRLRRPFKNASEGLRGRSETLRCLRKVANPRKTSSLKSFRSVSMLVVVVVYVVVVVVVALVVVS